jgi:hypothetical protein
VAESYGHRIGCAERKDVVVPNCERVMVIGSGVSFFEFLESVPQRFSLKGCLLESFRNGTNSAAEGGGLEGSSPTGLWPFLLSLSPNFVEGEFSEVHLQDPA